jgi:hypothetical protein
MSFFEVSRLAGWCRSADRKLRKAFDGAHNRRTINPRDRRLLSSSTADRLLAVNAYSRTALGRYFCEEIADRLCVNEYWEHDRPIFFVTLIPRDGLVAPDACRIDLASIKDRLRAHLKGQSYIGMLEPGYYASLPMNDRVVGHQAICWHVHLLVWNVTMDEIDKLLRMLRRSEHYFAVMDELPSCHAAQVANGELPDVVAYLLKPPSHAYRASRYPSVDRDGEIRLKPDSTPWFYASQWPSDLRKGERIKVFHAMKHLGLDDLLVGGGDGSAMRTRALRKAAEELVHRGRR